MNKKENNIPQSEIDSARIKERFKRFLKKEEKTRVKDSISKFTEDEGSVITEITETKNGVKGISISLHRVFREYGDKTWLMGCREGRLKMFFNIVNRELHPGAPKADEVAVIALKGTTFEDKRYICLDFAHRLIGGDTSGEVILKHEPDNPYDHNALAVLDKQTGQKIGYIPRQFDLNGFYLQEMQKNNLTGAYIMEARISHFNGKETAVLFLTTGWRNCSLPPAKSSLVS